jgi:hypothetical protein
MGSRFLIVNSAKWGKDTGAKPRLCHRFALICRKKLTALNGQGTYHIFKPYPERH